MSAERHPLEMDPDVERCMDCGNALDCCECPDAEAQRRIRESSVTPGHPVKAGAGYDCGCGQCIEVRTRVSASMAEVLAAHMLTDEDTCACTCDEMFYDWRLPPDQIKVEHSLHVEQRLAAEGYGAMADAWDAGFKQGGPMHDEHYGEPDKHKINPYRKAL